MQGLASVDVNANGDEEDGDEAEVDDGMDENRGTTSMHVTELNDLASAWDLKQKARAQQHKEQHSYNHWAPVRHNLIALCEHRQKGSKRSGRTKRKEMEYMVEERKRDEKAVGQSSKENLSMDRQGFV